MRTINKEIGELYYLDVTLNYVVVNDEYHGIIVMDFSLNIVRFIELGKEIVINLSLKHRNEMLLFCYENECAFYVDLEKGNVCQYDLSDLPDIYFSNVYFWKEDSVYLFADSGKLCVKAELKNSDMIRLSSSDISYSDLTKMYIELIGKGIQSYDHDKNSALIVRNSHYCIWNQENKTVVDMNIDASVQKKDEISSDQIYCKTSFSNDTVICVSEKNIMISLRGNKKSFVYPPYETYRYLDGKMANSIKRNVIFALCVDNSSEGISMLMRYDDFYQ